MGILDLIYPKYCIGCRKMGSYLCSRCFASLSFATEFICVVCNRPAIGGKTHPLCQGKYTLDGAVGSLAYRGLVKKLIYSFKYRPYVSHLTQTLGELFLEGIIQQESLISLLTPDTFLVPIPLHAEKLKKRGYNQATLLAESLGKHMSLPVLDAIIRIKKTESQFKLSKEERYKNIDGAFAVHAKYKDDVHGKTIILIDDLYTSGTTLQEAARILKKAGAKIVWGATLAHGK